MSDRDPRVDPRAGDVLVKGRRRRLVLFRSNPYTVAFAEERSAASGVRGGEVSKESWRRWARGAEVVAMAPQEAP